jgi:cAMP-binding proteins - catabolite gene activator and regulatory subunit of cAMP-dependent protein kinases
VAVVSPGHLIGELGFLDGEPHFEDVLAGPEGAVVLALSRQRLLALAEDDAVLGTRLLLNLAQAVSRRARYALWQTDRLQAAAQVEDTFPHRALTSSPLQRSTPSEP